MKKITEIDQAIEGLKNLKLFMEIADKENEDKFSDDTYKSVDIAIKALEKQVSLPVICFDYKNGTVNYNCPVCKGKIISEIGAKWCGGNFGQEYCDKCGQKLDWSDVE
jgi:hypothetical protein